MTTGLSSSAPERAGSPINSSPAATCAAAARRRGRSRQRRRVKRERRRLEIGAQVTGGDRLRNRHHPCRRAAARRARPGPPLRRAAAPPHPAAGSAPARRCRSGCRPSAACRVCASRAAARTRRRAGRPSTRPGSSRRLRRRARRVAKIVDVEVAHPSRRCARRLERLEACSVSGQRMAAAPVQQVEVDPVQAEPGEAATARGDRAISPGVVRIDLADDEDLVAGHLARRERAAQRLPSAVSAPPSPYISAVSKSR